ncbi:MAG: hypothetical protein ACE364_02765 [Chlorobiota bacterium]
MKSIAVILLLWFFIIPSSSNDKTISKDDRETIISNLKEIYGQDRLLLAYYSIEEFRPYSILQFESTVNKYSKQWVKPYDYSSLLTDKEKEILTKRIIQYIEDSEIEKSDDLVNKLKNYLYTFNTLENLSIANENYKLKSLQTLRNLKATRYAFENVSTLGEFEEDDYDSIELNQAKIKAYNIIADLDEDARYLYFSEYFKNYAKL